MIEVFKLLTGKYDTMLPSALKNIKVVFVELEGII